MSHLLLSHWPQQIIGPRQIQEVEVETPSLDGRSIRVKLKMVSAQRWEELLWSFPQEIYQDALPKALRLSQKTNDKPGKIFVTQITKD